MNVKRVKKNLTLNKRTICDLNIDQEDVLRKDELKTVYTGSDNTIPVDVGVTRHPKYC
jgi:hypothetical protein